MCDNDKRVLRDVYCNPMSKFSDKVDQLKKDLPECPKCGQLKLNEIYCKTKLCNSTVILSCS